MCLFLGKIAGAAKLALLKKKIAMNRPRPKLRSHSYVAHVFAPKTSDSIHLSLSCFT